jgi:hypothetical protein
MNKQRFSAAGPNNIAEFLHKEILSRQCSDINNKIYSYLYFPKNHILEGGSGRLESKYVIRRMNVNYGLSGPPGLTGPAHSTEEQEHQDEDTAMEGYFDHSPIIEDIDSDSFIIFVTGGIITYHGSNKWNQEMCITSDTHSSELRSEMFESADDKSVVHSDPPVIFHHYHRVMISPHSWIDISSQFNNDYRLMKVINNTTFIKFQTQLRGPDDYEGGKMYNDEKYTASFVHLYSDEKPMSISNNSSNQLPTISSIHNGSENKADEKESHISELNISCNQVTDIDAINYLYHLYRMQAIRLPYNHYLILKDNSGTELQSLKMNNPGDSEKNVLGTKSVTRSQDHMLETSDLAITSPEFRYQDVLEHSMNDYSTKKPKRLSITDKNFKEIYSCKLLGDGHIKVSWGGRMLLYINTDSIVRWNLDPIYSNKKIKPTMICSETAFTSESSDIRPLKMSRAERHQRFRCGIIASSILKHNCEESVDYYPPVDDPFSKRKLVFPICTGQIIYYSKIGWIIWTPEYKMYRKLDLLSLSKGIYVVHVTWRGKIVIFDCNTMELSIWT